MGEVVTHKMYSNSTATLEYTQGFMKVGYKNKKPFWHCTKCDETETKMGISHAWSLAVDHYNGKHRL